MNFAADSPIGIARAQTALFNMRERARYKVRGLQGNDESI